MSSVDVTVCVGPGATLVSRTVVCCVFVRSIVNAWDDTSVDFNVEAALLFPYRLH